MTRPQPSPNNQPHHPATRDAPLWIKQTTIALSVALVLGVGYLIINQAQSSRTAKKQTTVSENGQIVDTVDQKTILPTGKPINELGGWKQFTSPDGETFYSFSDTVDNIAINISQQTLPESFKKNTNAQIADMAARFGATTKLNADGTPVYIGTSAKGPQHVIFTKDKLLIMIKSEKKINDTAWVSYIQSLN